MVILISLIYFLSSRFLKLFSICILHFSKVMQRKKTKYPIACVIKFFWREKGGRGVEVIPRFFHFYCIKRKVSYIYIYIFFDFFNISKNFLNYARVLFSVK